MLDRLISVVLLACFFFLFLLGGAGTAIFVGIALHGWGVLQ